MGRINEAAYWNYQRDKFFVRTDTEARPNPKRPKRAEPKGEEDKRQEALDFLVETVEAIISERG